ncbi:pectate lyase-like adhesive domain-containing protein [Sporosarcina ureae]|uniref:pectate lyase-like adhesive domain-containing protein n=1 Tax=Sporosarcina ureae TaxID=1571 RepID=UPI0009DC5F06|nr:pectate lyase-like adhesive domain-containing protein [Sporosarcina ureae]ARF18101.1 hypothetical protein SporoP17a_12940 [Sporosarcina ureae]
MKQIWKAAFALILLVSVLGAGLKADAAAKPGTAEPVEKKPYEYEFVVDENAIYNEFFGAKEMVITFDKNINPTIAFNDVYVEQIVEGKNIKVPIVLQSSVNGNKLTITFKNLEFVDYIDKEDFQLVIKQGTLYFDQLTDYKLPFKFYDLTPGFESVFVNVDNADKINNKIFKHNEPRNIKIQVPPLYITDIETIHRYNGVTDVKAPNLSNIDVIADPRATRLKVELGVDNQFERDLDRSTAGVNGFSMGQAGISDLLCKDTSILEENCEEYNPGDDFQLTAYSESGRKLETRNFKMQINDRQKDFKISDYVKADAKQFGKPISLYDLMATPTTLEKIMEGTQLSALNKLGLTYSVGNSIEVNNLEQLQMALANDKFKTIIINHDISVMSLLEDTLVIDRNVTIKGGKNTPKSTITGHVQLGKEKNRIIRLENLDINGVLTVNVGEEGIAILDEVSVTGTPGPSTQIISGGKDSVHLNNFISTGGIVVQNKQKLRIVTTNTTTEPLYIDYKAQAPVDLEIVSGTVHLNSDDELTLDNVFNVVADETHATVNTTGKLVAPYFIFKNQTLQEDDVTNGNEIPFSGEFEIPVNGTEASVDIEEVVGKIMGQEYLGKLTSWKVIKNNTEWSIDLNDTKINISGIKKSGTETISFSAIDEKKVSYVIHLTIKIGEVNQQ